jgi:hypothetical protein
VPLTGSHYPAALARRFPRALSDNVALIGQKGASARQVLSQNAGRPL